MKDLTKPRSKAELIALKGQIDNLVEILAQVITAFDDMPTDAQLYAVAWLISTSGREMGKKYGAEAEEHFLNRFLGHLSRFQEAEIRVIRRQG